MTSTDYKELISRLTRLETKVIRGFEELGADTSSDPNWLAVEGDCIYVNTMGRSLTVMTETARKKGARIGQQKYRVIYKGAEVAVI